MEISGFDTVFYSNLSFEEIVSSLEEELKVLWPNLLINNTQLPNIHKSVERHERFYAKNQEMLNLHEEHGFNTRLANEGCVYLIGEKQQQFDLQIQVKEEIAPQSEFGSPDPYDSRVILKKSWQYTLVTPTSIEEEGFSQMIFNKLINRIKKS